MTLIDHQGDTSIVVSVVLVTYKRLQRLEQTVFSFLDTVTYPRTRMEIILCDDGSPADVQHKMSALPCDRFLLSRKNQGMGANTNKGLRAARGEFILQLQDDWRCVGPSDVVQAAIEVFSERPDVGIIRLRNAFDGRYEQHITRTGRTVHIYQNRTEKRTTAGEYVYSDNPHIKRRSLHEDLGLYKEHRSMVRTETDFCRRFEDQNRIRSAYIVGYDSFVHTGEAESFNPLAKRARIVRSLERFPPAAWALGVARMAKARLIRRASQ